MLLMFCSVMNRIRKRADIVVAFTQEYSRVSYPLRNVSILSKTFIHPRTPHYRRGKGQRGFQWLRIKVKVELSSCLLRATSFRWIRPASSCNTTATILPGCGGFHLPKQSCHHLLATFTNHGAISQPKVKSSQDTTSRPSFTTARVVKNIHLYQESYSRGIH